MRWALVALAGLLVTPAYAQTPRPGMRLTVTRVAPAGGFTASAFLVVHASTITRASAPECGAGALRIEADGHDERGRVRAAHLVAVVDADERAVAIGAAHCGASIELTLDDGSHLVAAHGTLRARLNGANGLDATLDSSVTDAAGVPTTITGRIVLAPS
jgi:hypothetical protein